MPTKISRTRAISALASVWAGIAVVRSPARAADFTYKYGNAQAADNFVNVYALEMAKDVLRDTKGRLNIQVFPASTLGGDAALIAQTRSGAIQFCATGGTVLAPIAPALGIEGVPFAFKSSKDAFAAQDGDLGAALRKELEAKAGFHVFPLELDAGMTNITTSNRPVRTADDLVGMKMRTPNSAIFVEVFQALGSSVTPLSIGEVYTALQTHVVDGQASALSIIEFQKLFEVQKYLSMTNMQFTGQWFYCNGEAWKALPDDIQQVVEKHARLYALRQRRSTAALTASLRTKLSGQGLIVNDAAADSFIARLGPYYEKARAEYGPLWDILRKYAPQLA